MKRMLKSLDACGVFDPDTGLLTRGAFWRDLSNAMAQAGEQGQAFSIARFSFDAPRMPALPATAPACWRD